jgi:hypothetical protein
MFLQNFNYTRYPFVQNAETFNAKLFFYSLQHNIHYTKMWKILFQVCKKMSFHLNCRFFNLHQSKLWSKHTYKNWRICDHFSISLSFFHGGMWWRKHLALMRSWIQTWWRLHQHKCSGLSFYFLSQKAQVDTMFIKSKYKWSFRIFLIIRNEINYTKKIVSPLHKSK